MLGSTQHIHEKLIKEQIEQSTESGRETQSKINTRNSKVLTSKLHDDMPLSQKETAATISSSLENKQNTDTIEKDKRKITRPPSPLSIFGHSIHMQMKFEQRYNEAEAAGDKRAADFYRTAAMWEN